MLLIPPGGGGSSTDREYGSSPFFEYPGMVADWYAGDTTTLDLETVSAPTGTVSEWRDYNGSHRTLIAPYKAMQPLFVDGGTTATRYVEFDGDVSLPKAMFIDNPFFNAIHDQLTMYLVLSGPDDPINNFASIAGCQDPSNSQGFELQGQSSGAGNAGKMRMAAWAQSSGSPTQTNSTLLSNSFGCLAIVGGRKLAAFNSDETDGTQGVDGGYIKIYQNIPTGTPAPNPHTLPTFDTLVPTTNGALFCIGGRVRANNVIKTGTNGGWKGRMYRVLLFNQQHNASERLNVYTRLKEIYGSLA